MNDQPTPLHAVPDQTDKVAAWYEASKTEPFGPMLANLRERQPRQDDDGTANLYYYDADRSLAFHWTGNPAHDVEVSQGGDHEDASWFFKYVTIASRLPAEDNPTDAPDGRTMLQIYIRTFQRTCELWIAMKEDAR